MQTGLVSDLIADYKLGMGLKKLSSKYKHDWTIIKRLLVDNGIPIKAQSENSYSQHTKQIVVMYNSGKSAIQIAKTLKIGRQAVYACLELNNIKRRPPHLSHVIYKLDVSTLADLSTEIGAYWFGFLCADGYINKSRSTRIRVNLARKDVSHLWRLANDVGLIKIPKNHTTKAFGKEYDGSYLTITSKELTDVYAKSGWFDFKHGRIDFSNNLNIRHFLRGFCDGDGVVTYGGNKRKFLRIGFCSKHSKILGWIRSYLVNELEVPTNKIDKQKIYYIFWSGSSALKIAEWLYTDQTRCLKRKLDKAMPFMIAKWNKA